MRPSRRSCWRWCGHRYGRLWDIETVNSAMKRSPGSTLRARTGTALKREAAIRVLTRAIKVEGIKTHREFSTVQSSSASGRGITPRITLRKQRLRLCAGCSKG
ncbi:MAG: hypothetical protein ACK4WH_14215 [Phycisphaerales bacterium]